MPTISPTYLLTDEVSLRVDSGVTAISQGERTVLLDYRRGQYYGLDEIGSLIWRLLAEEARYSAIVSTVVAQYDVSIETASADIAAIIAEFVDRGLVHNG